MTDESHPDRVNVLVLASGSSGNCLVVTHGERALMVDAGISPRTAQARARAAGLPLVSLDAVLLTHWHSDHASHASKMAVEYACPLIASKATLQAIEPKAPKSRNAVPGESQELPNDSPFEVLPIAIDHEEGSRAFVIQAGAKTVIVAHDLGHPPPALLAAAKSADVLCIEANYDPETLAKAPEDRYSPEMKARIASDDRGHLSNSQAAEVIWACSTDTLQAVVALHLSSRCNVATICEETLRAALDGYHARLYLASQDEPVLVEVNGRPDGVAELVGDDAQRAHQVNHDVDKLIAEQVAANEQTQRRRTVLGKLFAEMQELFLDNDPESLGLLDEHGEVCRHFTQWKNAKANALGISRRSADYYLDIGVNLLPLVPEEDVEEMSAMGADAVALYAKTKGEVPAELVEIAKKEPGHEVKREVFKRLFPGKTGHFEGPESFLTLTDGRERIKTIEAHLLAIRELVGNEAGESDAEIVEHALAEFFDARKAEYEQRLARPGNGLGAPTPPPDLSDLIGGMGEDA